MPNGFMYPGGGEAREEIAAEPVQDGTLTYTGSEQTPVWKNYNEVELTKSGEVAQTDVGTYTTLFTPTEDYCWPGGGTEGRLIEWTIDRAALPKPSLDKTSITLSESKTSDTFTVTYEGDGALSVDTGSSGIITASVAVKTVTVSSIGSTKGSATVTVHIGQGKNYEAYTANDVKVSVTADFPPPLPAKKSLNSMTWAEIDRVSAAGQAHNYWSVGDTKGVKINGIIGATSFNTTLYVYILEFDHNAALEGRGIHFGCFKTALTGGTDVCLVDNNYDTQLTNGTKCFNMNHNGGSNGGGWAACDMRYDILGSTNQQPSNYGTNNPTTATGKDPTSTCATNPVANTLMAALPSDLRAVMKPITKYTDNHGGKSTSVSHVTATKDYLPLLGYYEYATAADGGNPNHNESIYQKQYYYYFVGNSYHKYKHNSISTEASWYSRSPAQGYNDRFIGGSPSYIYQTMLTNEASGVAPIFMV